MKNFLFALVFLSGFQGLTQERNVTSEFVVWSQVSQKVSLGEAYSGYLGVQHRLFSDRESDYHLFFSAIVTRELSNGFSVSAGLINLNINRFVDTGYVLVPELRPVQSIQFSCPLNRSKFSWRLMTERRFFKNVADGRLVDGFNSNWRFRNKLGFNQYLSKRLGFIASSEIMANAGGMITNAFDQHRMQALILYRISSWDLETGYMHWFVQNRKNNFQNRHTWLINFTHSL